jgi:predicted DNA-binding transcriptional regulator AlpA
MQSNLDLIDKRETCRLFGGINPSSLYRGIKLGRYPKPLKIGTLSRWLRHEVEAALSQMAEARR